MNSASDAQHVVTIGNFDGVHRGHAFLLNAVVGEAQRRGLSSLVVTFDPHPLKVLRPDAAPKLLTSVADRERLLRAHGIDVVQVVTFDHAYSELSATAFLDRLVDETRPAAILIGDDFRFGHRRSGDLATMREHAAQHGYDVQVVPRIDADGQPLSSSAARAALLAGDVASAQQVLGRRFRMTGSVEHGAARGRDLGFPTANLALPDDMCIPGDGIYAAYARVEGIDYALPSMVYIGTRPTFDGGSRIVEVNILDFNGDIYTRTLEVEFVAWIRGDQAFESADALVARMHEDDIQTRAVLAATPPEDVSTRGAVY